MNIVSEINRHPGLSRRLASVARDPLIRPVVLFAKIKLLWRCNLACRFCERPSYRGRLSADNVAAMTSELALFGLRKIHFSGGEVLLHPEIYSILERCASSGIQVNLTTNGTLINRETARALVSSGVHAVSISLDGAAPQVHDRLRGTKGAFKATVKGMEHLIAIRKKHPKLRINTVVTARNIEALHDVHEFIRSLGSPVSWKLIPVDTPKKSLRIDENRAAKLMSSVKSWDDPRPEFSGGDSDSCGEFARGRYACDYYRRNICYMPWLHAFIDPAGFVYTCCMTRGRAPSLGRYVAANLEEILTGRRAQERRMAMAHGHAFPSCHACDDFIEDNKAIAASLPGTGR
jgi:MoaA/NifB/PqqE/SkfB family radical SAM enzyme